MNQKIRVILAGKTHIRINTIKNNFGEALAREFAANAEEFGYYYCPECHYYVREDQYDHRLDRCNACKGD